MSPVNFREPAKEIFLWIREIDSRENLIYLSGILVSGYRGGWSLLLVGLVFLLVVSQWLEILLVVGGMGRRMNLLYGTFMSFHNGNLAIKI